MSTAAGALPSPPHSMADIMALAANCPPVRCAVVHPCDAASLGGAIAAAESGLIEPVLVGPVVGIQAVAEAAALDISRFEQVPVEHSHAAADEVCRLARDGTVASIMKGSLHTNELQGAAVDRESGLCTGRRMSRVFTFEVPGPPGCCW